MRHYLCGRAHGHARFTTRPRRTGFHWREGPAKRVRERTAMYPRHRGSVVPRDPDSVDVSQGLELCSQPWRTAGCGSPRAHPPRTIPKLRAEAAPCPLRVRLGSRVTQSRLPVLCAHIHGTDVPVEEPSTASTTEVTDLQSITPPSNFSNSQRPAPSLNCGSWPEQGTARGFGPFAWSRHSRESFIER
jgi:hypothetical protein